MKILLLTLTMLFLLSACGREPDETPDENTLTLLPPATEDIYEPLIPRWVEGEDFLPEHLLCDFNYLMHILRLNFPLFGPAYRGRGIDIDLIEAHTRQAILDRNTDSHGVFSNMLDTHFFSQINNFGHLNQIQHANLLFDYANAYQFTIDKYSSFVREHQRLIYEAMATSAFIRFYGEVVDIGDYEDLMIPPGNVTTKILTEGEVAYINVRQFNHFNINHDSEIISAFFEEISDFSHLIIDLRLNPGGFPQYFYQIFVEPNISTPLEWQSIEFFSSGQHSRISADAIIADIQQTNPGIISISDNAAAFIAENDMRYFNQNDLAILQNVLTWHNKIYPTGEEMAFVGKIWILIGPRSASAVESVAIFAKETGFATLVGQPTAGVMPAMYTLIQLPNSGILVRYDVGYMTDSYGRSFEEFGVQPHYYNRPGMNALQTTLALIEEGAY